MVPLMGDAWRKFRASPMWAQITVWVVLAIVILAVIAPDEPEEVATVGQTTTVEQTTTTEITPEAEVYECPAGLSNLPCDELPTTTSPPRTTAAPATTVPPPPPPTDPPATSPPRTSPPATDPPAAASSCAPGYSPCVPPYPPDVNCGDLSFPVQVSGTDPHGLDRDGDGLGCESN